MIEQLQALVMLLVICVGIATAATAVVAFCVFLLIYGWIKGW